MLALAACSSAESPPAPVGGSSSGRTTPPGAVNAATNVLDTPPGTSTSSGGLGAIEGGPPPATTTTTTRPPAATATANCPEGQAPPFEFDLDSDGVADASRTRLVAASPQTDTVETCIEMSGGAVVWSYDVHRSATLRVGEADRGVPMLVSRDRTGVPLVLIAVDSGASAMELAVFAVDVTSDASVREVGTLYVDGSVHFGSGLRCGSSGLQALAFRQQPEPEEGRPEPGEYTYELEVVEGALLQHEVDRRVFALAPDGSGADPVFWGITGCRQAVAYPHFGTPAAVTDTLRSDAVCSEGELTAFDADLDGDGLPDRIRSTVSFDGERHWSLGCVEVGGATVHWQTELWGDITELPIDGIPSGAPVAVVPLPDGESLVLVPYSQGASTVQVSLLHYRTDADGPRISRIGGLSLGGSVGHGDGVRCVDGELHALQFRLVPDETLDLHQPGWYVHRLMLEPALHYQRIEFRSEAEPPPQQEDYWMISGCQLTYSWPRF